MTQYSEYKKLSDKYKNNPDTRPLLIDDFWKLFKVGRHHLYHKFRYYVKLFHLDIKADFCLSLDYVIKNTSDTTDIDVIKKILWAEFAKNLRTDRELKMGLSETMKSISKKRSRTKDGKDIPENLKNYKVLYQLREMDRFISMNDNPCNKPNARINTVELNYIANELQTHILKSFDVEDYEDWSYRFIHHESLRTIAKYRKSIFFIIKYKTDKVNVAVKKYYGNKH